MQASHCLAARPSLVPCAPGTLFVASALAINIYVSGAMRAPCRAMCSMVIRIWFVVLRRRDVMESRIAAAVRKLGIARWISEWSLYRPVYSRCSGCLFLSLRGTSVGIQRLCRFPMISCSFYSWVLIHPFVIALWCWLLMVTVFRSSLAFRFYPGRCVGIERWRWHGVMIRRWKCGIWRRGQVEVQWLESSITTWDQGEIRYIFMITYIFVIVLKTSYPLVVNISRQNTVGPCSQLMSLSPAVFALGRDRSLFFEYLNCAG